MSWIHTHEAKTRPWLQTASYFYSEIKNLFRVKVGKDFRNMWIWLLLIIILNNNNIGDTVIGKEEVKFWQHDSTLEKI
jgi:hypothetical protein